MPKPSSRAAPILVRTKCKVRTFAGATAIPLRSPAASMAANTLADTPAVIATVIFMRAATVTVTSMLAAMVTVIELLMAADGAAAVGVDGAHHLTSPSAMADGRATMTMSS